MGSRIPWRNLTELAQDLSDLIQGHAMKLRRGGLGSHVKLQVRDGAPLMKSKGPPHHNALFTWLMFLININMDMETTNIDNITPSIWIWDAQDAQVGSVGSVGS